VPDYLLTAAGEWDENAGWLQGVVNGWGGGKFLFACADKQCRRQDLSVTRDQLDWDI